MTFPQAANAGPSTTSSAKFRLAYLASGKRIFRQSTAASRSFTFFKHPTPSTILPLLVFLPAPPLA